jgi:AraC-like DNA-binding protein
MKMYMHLYGDNRSSAAATAAPPALMFRIAPHGAAQLVWRNRRVRLDEDAWLVLDGREPVAERPEVERGGEVFTVGISASERDAGLARALAAGLGARVTDRAGGLAFADCLRPISSPTGQRLLALAEQASVQPRRQPMAPDEAAALVSGAIDEELELRRRAERIACAKPETRAALLHRILLAADFIASHHDEPISLAEMASAVSLSRFHFGRLFSLVHGQTPHAFLLKKRTAVARRHLAVGAPCLDAATRAGFGSRSALFRNLRKSGHPTATLLAGRIDPCSLSA